MKEEIENKQQDAKSRWLRGAFVLLFLIIMRITTFLLFAIALFQFLHSLFVGRANSKVQTFGKNLGIYLNEIAQFVVYEVDIKPWPFADWPSSLSLPEDHER